MNPKIFYLLRNNEIVAYGCQFNDGQCVVKWEGKCRSIVIWPSFNDLKEVNGHTNTEFVFV